MPAIQQENGVKSVAGLPQRWGIRAYKLLKKTMGDNPAQLPDSYWQLSALLDEVTDAPIEIDATDAQICILAQRCAEDAQALVRRVSHAQAIGKIKYMIEAKGIEIPDVDDRELILRACDAAFWRRNLRKFHGRRFEHAAIRLGLVSVRTGAYCSNETVARYIARSRKNKNMLDAVKMQNQTTDQIYSLGELSAKGTSNKAIRRGELMLRMQGCEEIAAERGDVGIFVTRTLCSRFHAMMAKSGELNPKYQGASPREGAAALQKEWERTRAELHRKGIQPYGFRMAEPHHDGCPHWHMLVFVKASQVKEFKEVLTEYALEEAPEEVQHDTSIRIKFEIIDKEKGSACAYIAKYVSKNIGDEHVEEHVDSDGVITSTEDMGGELIKPYQRVAAWASCWGIRQFQAIGQPPVSVWRETRRVEYDTVAKAPKPILQAWHAAQRIEAVDIVTKEKKVVQAANFADYIKAQGGVCRGRKYMIGVAQKVAEIEGRYGLKKAEVPVGIYQREFKRVGKKEVLQKPYAIYESVRYQWKRVSGGKADFAFTWSPVNNCTEPEKGREIFWAKNLPEPEEIPPYVPEDCSVALLTEDEKIEFLTLAWAHAEQDRAEFLMAVNSKR